MKFLVERNVNAADQELLSLLYAAEESHVQSSVNYQTLTEEDVILYNHVNKEYARRKTRLGAVVIAK